MRRLGHGLTTTGQNILVVLPILSYTFKRVISTFAQYAIMHQWSCWACQLRVGKQSDRNHLHGTWAQACMHGRKQTCSKGVDMRAPRGLYVEDKIDLLMGYLVVNPVAALIGSVFGWQAKEKAKKVSSFPADMLIPHNCFRPYLPFWLFQA